MSNPTIPNDDPNRRLVIASADDTALPHLSVAGDTYTILLSGDDTAGRFCLINMHVPPGGGPPPHRHDFEETFSILDGQLDFIFRGQPTTARAGQTVHIPANAPHQFKNNSDRPARMLCLCSPAGQEKMFMEVGDPVAGRTSVPPKLSDDQKKARTEKAMSLAAKYKTELLKP